jgi:lipopolysaccharide export system permease protein
MIAVFGRSRFPVRGMLFMIGAPLGSIIRKGGLGMPLVIAVVFFLIFHITKMFGEKLSKQDALTPMGGMWMSTLLLLPIGIWLTWKAMNDSQLFSNEFYFRGFRKLVSLLPKRKSKAEA